MICTRCNAENVEAARFCRKCGAALDNIQIDKIQNGRSFDTPQSDDSSADKTEKEVLEIDTVNVEKATGKKKLSGGTAAALIVLTVIGAVTGLFVYKELNVHSKINKTPAPQTTQTTRVTQRTQPKDREELKSEKFITIGTEQTEAPTEAVMKSDGSLVYDTFGLFSESYRESLERKLEALSNSSQMDIATVIIQTANGLSIENFAEEYYKKNNYGRGSAKNGAVLVLDVKAKDWFFFTNGKAQDIFPPKTINAIFYDDNNSVTDYWRSNDWLSGYETFVEKCGYYYSRFVSSVTEPSFTAPSFANDGLPPELEQYADRLTPENRWYVVVLEYYDWNIKARSTPEYFGGNVPNDNTVGLIKSGTEIFVEYLCDGTWAVYQMDGRYVFSSLFDANDAARSRLLEPIGN